MKCRIQACLQAKVPLNSEVTVEGWVRTKRDSKAGISFIHLHDGSGFSPIQVIAPHTLSNYETELKSLTTGCALSVTGTLVASPAQGQACEINARDIRVMGTIADPERYPIQPKRHTLEYLREVPHLRMRTNTIGAMTRVRHQLAHAIHQFFHEQGFYWISTPLITSSDCEGAGELFRVSTLDLLNLPKTPDGKIDFSKDFFGKETFLTVSGQLNLEAYCLAMSKVYTFGPTFRAENSHTSRHLAEFWMVEPEIAFADLSDIMTLAQSMLHFLAKNILDTRGDDLAFFTQHIDKDCMQRLEKLATTKFEHITYTDAVKRLQQADQVFQFPVSWGLDLQSEHERYLCEQVFQCPVVVTDYPIEIKSFYMRLNEDEKTVANMDVLAPGIGEIIGGSAREDRIETLIKRMQENNIDIPLHEWYLDLRRYGGVPHAGFGLGFERLLGYFTGLSNIRDLIPFPRTPGHAAL